MSSSVLKAAANQDSLLPRFGHSIVDLDPKAEAKLRWKIDLYVLPTVAILYLFCFIDRANIGPSLSLSLSPQRNTLT